MAQFNGVMPHLKMRHFAETKSFYTDLLGFKATVCWPVESPSLCVVSKDGVRLMFDLCADWDDPGSAPTLTGQMVFDVTDVLQLFESLKDKVDVLWGPEVYAYGRREFSIKDPNGYRLVFSETTDDPVTCQE